LAGHHRCSVRFFSIPNSNFADFRRMGKRYPAFIIRPDRVWSCLGFEQPVALGKAANEREPIFGIQSSKIGERDKNLFRQAEGI
jgi:hypothetical protein